MQQLHAQGSQEREVERAEKELQYDQRYQPVGQAPCHGRGGRADSARAEIEEVCARCHRDQGMNDPQTQQWIYRGREIQLKALGE